MLDSTVGWEVIGNPDLTRSKLFAFVIEANKGVPVAGSIFLDDMVLIESGGFLDVMSAPIQDIVDRLTYRQFRGLWGSRDHTTGLVPSISSFAEVSALNASGELIALLPMAVQLGWVNRSDADNHISHIVGTLNTVMDVVTPPCEEKSNPYWIVFISGLSLIRQAGNSPTDTTRRNSHLVPTTVTRARFG